MSYGDRETSVVKVKWYYRPVWIFVAILAVGPLAIPLVWLSPTMKRWHKILIIIAVLLITVWLVKAMMDIFREVMKQVADLQAMH